MSDPENIFKNLNSGFESIPDNDDTGSNGDENQNQYIIKDTIAVGGLKEVKIARDRRTGRDVAMAVLKKDFQSPDNNERFLREARILATLEHANIVPIHEINKDDSGDLFFTMKLLSGETLASIIKKLRNGDKQFEEIYTARKLLGIFIQVCNAVSYAHSKSIIHFDIKPENIQISEFGEVLILDWGMARNSENEDDFFENNPDLPAFTPITTSITQGGIISGSPGFMSPEQVDENCKNRGTGSDIYSLGATLFAIINKYPPYHGLKVETILEKTKAGEKPEFSKSNSSKSIPHALQSIARKAMQFNPDERYNNVEELKKDIERYLNDYATLAENINLFKYLQLFLKRNQKKAIASVFVCSLLSIITYFSYSEIREQAQIIQAEKLKSKATADEILKGALEKNNLLRKQNKYKEIFANLQQLKDLGYDLPEFWHEEARLYVGELKFKEALKCLDKVESFGSVIDSPGTFNSLRRQCEMILAKSEKQKINRTDILNYAVKLPMSLQRHIFWNMKQDPNVSTKEKLEHLRSDLYFYNKQLKPGSINYSYEIKDGYVKVDLSNNPKMNRPSPLWGIRMDELILQNTGINYSIIIDDLRYELKVLNVSDMKKPFNDHLLHGSIFEKIIARNTIYHGGQINKARRLKHLDLERAFLAVDRFKPSQSLEHLNIAFTTLEDFNSFKQMPKLKKLVIDKSMIIPNDVMESLRKQGTEIVVK